jgi:hypothetical protein
MGNYYTIYKQIGQKRNILVISISFSFYFASEILRPSWLSLNAFLGKELSSLLDHPFYRPYAQFRQDILI